MSACRNLTMIIIVLGVIGICYKFLPFYSVRRIIYNPTCMKLVEKNEYLCAYCCINSFSNELQTKHLMNREGFKAIGIKSSQSLTCQQYLQIVDYDKYLIQPNEIQIQKIDIISNIIKQLNAQNIVVDGKKPIDLIITKNTYKSIVIYQTNKQKKMNTVIHQIVQEDIIYKIVIILACVCLPLIFYHISKNFINNQQIQYTIVINIAILILVYLQSQQKLTPNIDQYQIPAILFFGLCLFKVNISICVNIFIVIVLIVGYEKKISDLTTVTYAVATILYIINAFNQVKHSKVFGFVSIYMIVYMFSQRYILNDELDQNTNYYLGKTIQLVILTMVTTLMEINNQKVITQFTELQQNIPNKSQSIHQFQELQQNNFQDEDIHQSQQ